MPRNFVPTPNTHETMTRPIAQAIARQLLRALELPEDTKILFPGDAGQMAQKGTTAEEQFADPSSFSFDDRFSIEITERPDEDFVLPTLVHQKDAAPYFLDPKIGVELKPVYSHTVLEFSIILRSRSRDRARRIRDEILARRAMSRETHLHEVQYSYCVPDIHLHLLKQIHQMREETAGYGEGFSQWVNDHITERATNLTNQAGTQTVLAIQETQGEILGWFDFAAIPEGPEKDNDAGTWTWSMNYVVKYDKVIGTAAHWPLVVHNAIIPEPWHNSPLASGTMIDPARRPSRAGIGKRALREATGNFLHRDFCAQRAIDGVIYPVFDDWIPETVHPSTSTVLVALMQVDLNQPEYVGQIGDFIDFTVDPDVLEFMRSEHQYLNTYNQSIVHVSLFENGIPLDDELIRIDADLNVYKTTPMNPRMTYRLRVALFNNLLGLNHAARQRLLRAGVAGQKILMSLQWKTLYSATVPPLQADGSIAFSYYHEVGVAINHAKGIHYTGIEYRMLTVGDHLICMHRRNDDASNAHTAGTPTGDGSHAHGERHPLPGCDGGYPIPAQN